MKNNFFFLVIVSLFLFSIVSADLGTFKQNECVNLRTILNTTSVNISTITPPDSVMIVINQGMTKNGLTFNYTYCNTTPLGVYVYDYFDNEGEVYVNNFEVTLNGKEKPSEILVVVYTILFILIFFFGLVYFFKALEEFTLLRMDLRDVIIMIGTYLSMWIFYYFSWEYLGNEFINTILEIAISVGSITHVLLPIIGFMTSFILQKLKMQERNSITY